MSRLYSKGIARVGGRLGLELLIVALLSFPAWRPLLAAGHPGGHDSLFHLFRLVDLDAALRAGVLYPRLAPNLAMGYDYPVFNYYAPLSIYLAELFKLVGLGYVDAVKAVLALSIVASGWTMLLFARTLLPRSGAWLAALAYAYLPYLLVDVYVRGALAEALALPLLPLCLWAFQRLARQVSPGRGALAGLSLALILVTHNVTTLTFAPVLGAYWLLTAARSAGGSLPNYVGIRRRGGRLWPPPERADTEVGPYGDGGPLGRQPTSALGRQNGSALRGEHPSRHVAHLLLGGFAAGGLALALAAFYWVPAFFERGLVASGGLTQEFFDYHEHFQPLSKLVQTSLAYDYGYDFFSGTLFRAGLVQVAVAALGLVAALLRPGPRRASGLFWGAVLIGGILLQSSRAAPVWEALPLIAYVQFPWRLLAPVGLASSLLAGHVVGVLEELRWPAWRLWAVAGLLTLALAASASFDLRLGRNGLHEADIQPWALQHRELDRKQVAATVGEYLPVWATTRPFEYGELPPASPANASARVTVREAGLFSLELDVVAEETSRVLLDRFFFPGWQAHVDEAPVGVRPEGPLGLLAVDVPPGEHRLSIWFGDTPLRTGAAVASFGGALALVALIARTSAAGLRRSRGGLAGRNRLRPGAVVGTGLALALSISLVVGGWPSHAAAGTTSPLALAPVASDFGQAIRLAGATLDGFEHDKLKLTLYWQARERPARDYVVALRLLSTSGQVVGERDKRPLFGLRPTDLWEAGQVVRDHQEIALSPGAPAGEYDLVVGLFDPDSGAYLPPLTQPAVAWRDDAGAGTGVHVGRVSLPERPPVAATPLRHASSARFGDAVGLESYQLSRLDAAETELPLGDSSVYAATVGQGERLRISLLWRALRDLDRDYAVFTHLLDSSQGMLAQDDEWPHRGFYPTSLWLPGELVSDEYEVQIPANTPPGRYDLSIGLYTREDLRRLTLGPGQSGADRLSLGSVKVVARPPLTVDRLAVRRRTDANLGGVATLLGYGLPNDRPATPGAASPTPAAPLAPGGRLALTLYWQADRQPAEDYTVFVHLYDAQGALKAQADGQPARGDYPTTLWEPGEIVVDQRTLDLGPDLPPGQYRLEIGMYQLATGARLKLPSGEDKVFLESLRLER